MSSLAVLTAEAMHAAKLVSSEVLAIHIEEVPPLDILVRITVSSSRAFWNDIVVSVRARLDDICPAGIGVHFVVLDARGIQIFDSRPAVPARPTVRAEDPRERVAREIKRCAEEIFYERCGREPKRLVAPDVLRALDAYADACAAAIAEMEERIERRALATETATYCPATAAKPSATNTVADLYKQTHVRVLLYCGHETHAPEGIAPGNTRDCRECMAMRAVVRVLP